MRSAASGSDTVDAASPGKKPPRDEARQHAVTASVCCAAISGLTELAAKSLSAFFSLKPERLHLTPASCTCQVFQLAPKQIRSELAFGHCRCVANSICAQELHVHTAVNLVVPCTACSIKPACKAVGVMQV